MTSIPQADPAKVRRFSDELITEISRINREAARLKSHGIPYAALWPTRSLRSKLTYRNLWSSARLLHVDETMKTPTGFFYLPLVSKAADNQLIFHIMRPTSEPVGEDEEDADVEPRIHYEQIGYEGGQQFCDDLLNAIRRKARERLHSKPRRELVILSDAGGFSVELIAPEELTNLQNDIAKTYETLVTQRDRRLYS